ncbi:MAG: hypothetical protein Q8N94_03625 [Methanoregula sp.]|nr:hypothetical protein [Methanoregula sp.]
MISDPALTAERAIAFLQADLPGTHAPNGYQNPYMYLLDPGHHSNGDVKVEARELSEQIKMRMEMG